MAAIGPYLKLGAVFAVGVTGGIFLDVDGDSDLELDAIVSSVSWAASPRNIGLLLLAAIFGIWHFKRRETRQITDFANTSGQTTELASLARTAAHIAERPMQNASSEFLKNPFAPEFSNMSFDTRVQASIEASLRNSKVIGVIHFGFAAQDNDKNQSSAADLASLLRRQLRNTDYVRVIDENNICVFISQLSQMTRLKWISNRLACAATRFGAVASNRLIGQGCAIYPLDGYSVAELMKAATDRSDVIVAGRLIQIPDKRSALPGVVSGRRSAGLFITHS